MGGRNWSRKTLEELIDKQFAKELLPNSSDNVFWGIFFTKHTNITTVTLTDNLGNTTTINRTDYV